MGKRDDYKGLYLPYMWYNPKEKKKNVATEVNYMLARSRRMFKHNNIPETIPERNLEVMLQTHGHVCITKVNGELYALCGEFSGVPDAYYIPTQYVVANPYLNFNATLTIGQDCVIIKNDSMYMGLIPGIIKYSNLIMETELTMSVVNTMARSSLVFSAEDESDLQSAREYIKNLADGDLSIITRDGLLKDSGVDVQPGATSAAGILTNLIEERQYWQAARENFIGLSSNWNAKRESLTESETMLNEDSLWPLCDDMLMCRQEGWKEVEKLFGVKVDVSYNSIWETNEKEMEAKEEMLDDMPELDNSDNVDDNIEDVVDDEREEDKDADRE